jgi:hypothetical protein
MKLTVTNTITRTETDRCLTLMRVILVSRFRQG